MGFNQNADSVTGVNNQRIERREFLRKSFGLLAVIGLSFVNLKCKTTRGEKKVFTIDLAKCNGCGKCTRECHHKALSIENEKALIDQKLCGGCGECVVACGRKAILERKYGLIDSTGVL